MKNGRVQAAVACGLALAAAVLTPSAELQAQEGGAAHAHMGHVLEGFGATPDGDGLLPTAQAEAEVAAQHAGLAAADRSNLQGMQLHARHVLHAVDPGQIESGPGLGFGVKQAAEGIAQHIQLAAGAEGASDAVRTHAEHVATAARAVAQRAEEIVDLVDQIENAYDYTEAGEYVGRLETLAEQLTTGADSNGDGQIGLDEGGLQHVDQHMQLMAGAEGL